MRGSAGGSKMTQEALIQSLLNQLRNAEQAHKDAAADAKHWYRKYQELRNNGSSRKEQESILTDVERDAVQALDYAELGW